MGLMDLIRRPKVEVLERSTPLGLGFDEWAGLVSSFQFNGVSYTLPGASQENIGGSFAGMARGGYKGNGVVFACMGLRMSVFSEARFMFRNVRRGRPGDLFDYEGSDLELLRSPWEGGTTGDLLSRMIQHADIAGNAYVVRRPGRLTPLRPDWVSIIGGVDSAEDATVWHPDARVLGYMYQEGGPSLGKEPVFFLPEEVAHFAPVPDPEARFRGMSWLTPIVRQVMADKAMDDHKLAFFENGATPNLAVTLNVDSLDKFRDWVKELKGNHEGAHNAYKTLFLAAGANAEVLGSNMQQLDFKIVQGGGETRVAAAAGTPPVLVGLSEGLAAATYANYKSAARRFVDMTMRNLWRNVSGSLAQIVRVPGDSELWYDDRDVKALQDDEIDAATITQTDSGSAQTLVNSGFTPESVVKAIAARDLTLLVHTGLLSVQLQAPGSSAPDEPPVPVRDDPLDKLELDIMLMLRERDHSPINVNVTSPDVQVDVHPPLVTVEPASVTVEPTRFEKGAIEVHVDAAPVPDVNVTVEPAQIQVDAPQITVEPTRIDPGAIQVTVEAQEPPEVNVTVERSGKRRVDFGDGRGATVTEGDVKRVVYDDGREVTITELGDDE